MQPARNGVSLGRVIGPKNEAIKMGCKKEQKKRTKSKGQADEEEATIDDYQSDSIRRKGRLVKRNQ